MFVITCDSLFQILHIEFLISKKVLNYFKLPESEFNDFEPRLKNRFQLSAGLIFETLNTILSGTNQIL